MESVENAESVGNAGNADRECWKQAVVGGGSGKELVVDLVCCVFESSRKKNWVV